MKFLTALDCLSSRVKLVLEEDRPPRQVPENTLYAVFTHDIHTGTFCGLASQYDIVLHPDWIFADLVEHRPLESVMPDTPLNQVFDRMRKLQCETLPVLDEQGNFLGAISSGSLLEKLLRQERALLKETRRLYKLTEKERRELELWSGRLNMLQEASRTMLNVLAHTAIEAELLQAGIDALANMLEAEYGAIGILDAEGGLAQFVYTGISEQAASRISHLPEGRGLLGLVIQENMPIRLEDMTQHPQSAGFPPGHPVMTSLLAVPVSHAGRVYGRIYLSDKKNGEPFTEADELLAMSFARSLSLVLDNAREFEEINRAQQKLDYLAHFDVLTTLPNRELAMDRIQQAILYAHRHKKTVAILFIDLDNFKNVNDAFGHHAGDSLLQQVAKRLTSSVREGDTVARLAGDEFLVMLPEIEEAQAVTVVAQKVLDVLVKPFKLDGREIFIGISIYPDDAVSVEEMLRASDTAMYYAKSSGKNQFQFFTKRMNDETRRYIALESALRLAIPQGELFLLYQPQVSSESGCIIGVEALLRWNSGTLGEISPAEFIPVAETSGLIFQIGDWVLEAVCRQAKAWQLAGVENLKVAVNISPRQFRDEYFANRLEKLLADIDLKASILELEITESIMMADTDAIIAMLIRLMVMGVYISIDDFGTGYSSLSRIKHFPITQIKIDQSFVHDLPDNEDDAAIVRTIIGLAHNLKLQVVAEGVETRVQLEFLLECGCDGIQGYLFSKAVAAEEVLAMWRNNARLQLPSIDISPLAR